MLRQRPQLETEETVEEERAADEEERRKTEALSEIEVTPPSPGELRLPPHAHHTEIPTLGAWASALALPPAGSEGGPGAQWSPHAVFR
jgi:hypothetical protein